MQRKRFAGDPQWRHFKRVPWQVIRYTVILSEPFWGVIPDAVILFILAVSGAT